MAPTRSRPPGGESPLGRRRPGHPPRDAHPRDTRPDRENQATRPGPPEGRPARTPRRGAASLDLASPEARRESLAAVLGSGPNTIPNDTLARLTTLVELLATWTRRINLVGSATVPNAWNRHVLDSAALWPLIPPTARRLADLGSGAGFPGLVLAILGAPDVQLVESDQRKAAFLREAARVTATPVTIHAQRIEALEPLNADVVSARALAPLPELLPLVVRHLTPDGVALLPKGRTADDELTACANQWIMRMDRSSAAGPPSDRPSAPTPPGRDSGAGLILILREIRRVASGT